MGLPRLLRAKTYKVGMGVVVVAVGLEEERGDGGEEGGSGRAGHEMEQLGVRVRLRSSSSCCGTNYSGTIIRSARMWPWLIITRRMQFRRSKQRRLLCLLFGRK